MALRSIYRVNVYIDYSFRKMHIRGYWIYMSIFRWFGKDIAYIVYTSIYLDGLGRISERIWLRGCGCIRRFKDGQGYNVYLLTGIYFKI